MSIYFNLGYRFKINNDLMPNGSILLASTIAMHTLWRRKFTKTPQAQRRLFDPQLYMAGLDPNQSGKVCTKLASYPWFGIKDISEYDSNIQSQNEWSHIVEQQINQCWRRNVLNPQNDSKNIEDAIRMCIDFQLNIGCEAIILPSPLTYDFSTNYSDELFWLDKGLQYIKSRSEISIPVYATIALNDNCLRYSDPQANSLLKLIYDSVGAREPDGIYFVVEQGNEPDDTKHISNTRVLLM